MNCESAALTGARTIGRFDFDLVISGTTRSPNSLTCTTGSDLCQALVAESSVRLPPEIGSRDGRT
jgi:hypothetical protein